MAQSADVSHFDFQLDQANESDLLFDVQLPGGDAADETVFLPLYGPKTPQVPQRTLLGRAREDGAARRFDHNLADSLFQQKDPNLYISTSCFTSTPHVQHASTSLLSQSHYMQDAMRPSHDLINSHRNNNQEDARPDILKDLRATLRRSQSLLHAPLASSSTTTLSKLPRPLSLSRSHKEPSSATLVPNPPTDADDSFSAKIVAPASTSNHPILSISRHPISFGQPKTGEVAHPVPLRLSLPRSTSKSKPRDDGPPQVAEVAQASQAPTIPAASVVSHLSPTASPEFVSAEPCAAPLVADGKISSAETANMQGNMQLAQTPEDNIAQGSNILSHSANAARRQLSSLLSEADLRRSLANLKPSPPNTASSAHKTRKSISISAAENSTGAEGGAANANHCLPPALLRRLSMRADLSASAARNDRNGKATDTRQSLSTQVNAPSIASRSVSSTSIATEPSKYSIAATTISETSTSHRSSDAHLRASQRTKSNDRRIVKEVVKDIFSPNVSEDEQQPDISAGLSPKMQEPVEGAAPSQTSKLDSIASSSTSSDIAEEADVKPSLSRSRTHIQDGSISFGSPSEQDTLDEEQLSKLQTNNPVISPAVSLVIAREEIASYHGKSPAASPTQHEEEEEEEEEAGRPAHDHSAPHEDTRSVNGSEEASENESVDMRPGEEGSRSRQSAAHWEPAANLSLGWANISRSRSMSDIANVSAQSQDDMFSRKLRDSNLHRGLDLAAENSPGGPIQSITGFTLPPGPPIIHLQPKIRFPSRAVRPTVKLTEELPLIQANERKRSISVSEAKDRVPVKAKAGLTMPKEFNFTKRTRQPKVAGIEETGSRPKMPRFDNRTNTRRVVSAPKARSQASTHQISAAVCPPRSDMPLQLSESALAEQERSLRYDEPQSSKVEAFLNSLHEAQEVGDHDRQEQNLHAEASTERIIPLSISNTAESVKGQPIVEKPLARGMSKTAPGQAKTALRTKTNGQVKDCGKSTIEPTRSTEVKAFNFASSARVRNREAKTQFEDKLFDWQDTENAAAASGKRYVVPLPSKPQTSKSLAPATETQRARERVVKATGGAPKVEQKRKREAAPFTFATTKRARGNPTA